MALPDDQEKALLEKCEQNPDDSQVRFELAMLLIDKGRHEDSVWILLRCIEMDKKD